MKNNTKNTVETKVETVETANEKAYTFRKLNSTDLFLMFKIIGKIGINEFTACFDGETMNRMLQMAKGKAKEETSWPLADRGAEYGTRQSSTK